MRQHAIAGNLSDETLAAITSKGVSTAQQDEVLSKFQEEIKALTEKKAPAKDFLTLRDQLRDVHLWDLGIYLEDREGLPAIVRPIDSALRVAQQQKEEREQQKREAKEKREKEEAEKAAKKAELAKLSPLDMFRTQEYSGWDDKGLPIRDAKSEEIPKNKMKKLYDEWMLSNRK